MYLIIPNWFQLNVTYPTSTIYICKLSKCDVHQVYHSLTLDFVLYKRNEVMFLKCGK
uniref:Uncharacterized protein n=1 Tax=Ciona intestinalis TaxID=7719 RepID=H2XWT5_CIOIN